MTMTEQGKIFFAVNTGYDPVEELTRLNKEIPPGEFKGVMPPKASIAAIMGVVSLRKRENMDESVRDVGRVTAIHPRGGPRIGRPAD